MIIIGSDHRGFTTKQYILENAKQICFAKSTQAKLIDTGCYNENSTDFPDIIFNMIEKWNENSIGILICGSGIGMSICANRFPFIRAALCHTTNDVISARQHNNANILVLSSEHNLKLIEMINLFINTPFSDQEKYIRRIEKMSQHNQITNIKKTY